MKRDAVDAAISRRLVSLYRRIALYGAAPGWFVSPGTAFCVLRQRNPESEPDERGQCAAEAERHCDHGCLHDSLGDFAPPAQVSEVALGLDRLGRIDAETKERLLRRLFSRHASNVLNFISVHQSSPKSSSCGGTTRRDRDRQGVAQCFSAQSVAS